MEQANTNPKQPRYFRMCSLSASELSPSASRSKYWQLTPRSVTPTRKIGSNSDFGQFGGMMDIYCLGGKTWLICGPKEAKLSNILFWGPFHPLLTVSIKQHWSNIRKDIKHIYTIIHDLNKRINYKVYQIYVKICENVSNYI